MAGQRGAQGSEGRPRAPPSPLSPVAIAAYGMDCPWDAWQCSAALAPQAPLRARDPAQQRGVHHRVPKPTPRCLDGRGIYYDSPSYHNDNGHLPACRPASCWDPRGIHARWPRSSSGLSAWRRLAATRRSLGGHNGAPFKRATSNGEPARPGQAESKAQSHTHRSVVCLVGDPRRPRSGSKRALA